MSPKVLFALAAVAISLSLNAEAVAHSCISEP
jgi:hypothetical protein